MTTLTVARGNHVCSVYADYYLDGDFHVTLATSRCIIDYIVGEKSSRNYRHLIETSLPFSSEIGLLFSLENPGCSLFTLVWIIDHSGV